MPLFKAWQSKAISDLGGVLAVLGLLFTSFLTVWVVITSGNFMMKVAAGLAALACAGYLVVRRHLPSAAAFSSAQVAPNSRLRMVLNILFFLLFSYSVLSLYLRPELYVRPLGYFVSVAVMVVILALEILLLPSEKKWNYLTLFKIIMVGLSVEWSLLLLFPTVVGVDPWFHQSYTRELLETGHVPAYSGYAKLPIMHLIISTMSLITGLSYKIAATLSISLSHMVCCALFVFLLGRLLYGDRVGLASALFLSIANMYAHFGIWIIPLTAGALFILPVIYLLFKIKQDNPVAAISLSLLLMAVLILTHAIVAVCMAVLLFIFWAGFKVYSKIRGEKFLLPVSLGIAILFSVGMLGWWMYASGPPFITLVELSQWGFNEQFWGTPLVTEAKEYMSLSVPFLEWMFGKLGMLLFFALSLVGFFYMVGTRSGNRYSFVLAISGVILLAFGFLSQVAELKILAERWHYFTQIMLAIPFGVVIVLIFGELLKSRLIKIPLMISFCFLIAFLMIMNPDVNMDNRTFTPNTAIRFAFTESEQQALGTISNMWDGEIGTDARYSAVGTSRKLDIDEALYSGDFSSYRDVPIIIREEITRYPFSIYKGFIKMRYDPYRTLEEQGFITIYSCGSVTGFLKPDD